MNISFSIISRGIVLVQYGNKEVRITGELTFEPPVFYADIHSITKWESPFEEVLISENEKREIIYSLTNESSKKGQTKIIFD
jgi:hypothetical protein